MIDSAFLKNGSWAFAGNFLYALFQWGILVVLAKIGSAKMVGLFTLGLAVTAPIVLFTHMQLRNVIATDAKGAYDFREYFGVRLVGVFVAYAAIGIVVVMAGYEREAGFVIMAVGLAKLFEGISDMFYGLFQRHENFVCISISKIARGAAGLAAMAVVIHLSHNVFMAVLALAFAWGIVLFAYDIPHGNLLVARPVRACTLLPPAPKLEISTFKNLIWLTLPLGFVEMLASFNINAPRYVIESKIGISELGIFSSMSYFMVAGGTLVYALGQAAMPRLANYYHQSDPYAFAKLLFVLVAASTTIGLVGIAIAYYFGELLLELFYREEFAAHNKTFVVIMMASAFNYIATICWFGIASAWKFRIQVLLFGGALIVNVFMCFWLIPSHGILGGAMALTFSELFRVLVSIGVLAWIFRSGFICPSSPS